MLEYETVAETFPAYGIYRFPVQYNSINFMDSISYIQSMMEEEKNLQNAMSNVKSEMQKTAEVRKLDDPTQSAFPIHRKLNTNTPIGSGGKMFRAKPSTRKSKYM